MARLKETIAHAAILYMLNLKNVTHVFQYSLLQHTDWINMPEIINSTLKKDQHRIVMFHFENFEQVIAVKKFKD